jgi:hypothetical protein
MSKDKNNRNLDDRLTDQADRFYNDPVKTTGKWLALAVTAIILLAIALGIGNFACGWFNKAAEVAGPENVSAQYAAVIEGWESLEAAALNACAAKNNPDTESTLIEDPAFAYAATYRKIAVDYNRRQKNIFEAKVVGPDKKVYPEEAPTLEEMQRKLGCN